MKYRVKNEYNCEFDNVKRIAIGTGRVFCVYANDIPFLSVEVNALITNFFVDSVILGDYLFIGNYTDGVCVINLKDFNFHKISVDGYFGYFEKSHDYVYILGCENIIALYKDGNIVWKSDPIAVDGIVCDGIEGQIMHVSCEMDPPGGWKDMKIDLLTGKTI